MAQMTILDQQSTINRTNKFIEKYGVAKKWMAVKVQIPLQKFSYFCNGRFALSEPEFNRLTAFAIVILERVKILLLHLSVELRHLLPLIRRVVQTLNCVEVSVQRLICTNQAACDIRNIVFAPSAILRKIRKIDLWIIVHSVLCVLPHKASSRQSPALPSLCRNIYQSAVSFLISAIRASSSSLLVKYSV